MQETISKTNGKISGLGLCSGGLDSILAGCVLRSQGIDVHWITFETPFFSAQKARKAANLYGFPLIVEDITPIYLDMLKDPPAGYGKCMNPCMDCHSLMFRIAGGIMKAKGFHFLFSGEVLGQRPMSQVRPSLRYVAKHSGYDGYIIRPLSAGRLEETIPEQKGWVDRSRLLDLAGRSRKPQIQIAKTFGVTEYPAPAGGCLLTDKGYSRRLADLFENNPDYTVRDLHLLKHGRHLRLAPAVKVVVGRTQGDNRQIARLYDPKRDLLCSLVNRPGPVVLVPGGCDLENRMLAATICASYSKAPRDLPAAVHVKTADQRTQLEVLPLPTAVFQDKLI